MKPTHQSIKQTQRNGLLDEYWGVHIPGQDNIRAAELMHRAHLRDTHKSNVSQLIKAAAESFGNTQATPAKRLEIFETRTNADTVNA